MVYKHEELNSLVGYFSNIEDPRDNRGKRHRLTDIFVMAIYGLLWGHTDFTNMAAELRYHEKYFEELLGIENGIPSHDTFSALFSVINAEEFLESFIQWIASVANTRGKHIALDGKAVRAACDKVHRNKIPYIVNAYLVDEGLCVGQIKVDEKTNEIKGIPEMLSWMDLDGSVITTDAIGCQKEIVKLLSSKQADFVLPVKGNQSTLHKDIMLDMNLLIKEKATQDKLASQYRVKHPYEKSTPYDGKSHISEFEQYEKSHSRVERRTYYTSGSAQAINTDDWPQVADTGLVIRERTVIHKDADDNVLAEDPTVEFETYILSRKMDAEEFACYARGHWGIENSLHWVLDDYFREDRCTSRTKNATENIALLRKAAFNLMKLDDSVAKKSMKGKQVYFRNNPDAIAKLLFETIPNLYG